jgi:Tol biopolymer transport system component
MKRIMLLLTLILSLCSMSFCSLHVDIGKETLGIGALTSSVKLLLCVAPQDQQLTLYAKIIQANLQRTGQFLLSIEACNIPTKKADVKKLFDKGYSLVVFLNHADNDQALEWRLYDVSEASMVKGRKVIKKDLSEHALANILSDELWLALTQQPSSFSSKIAYTKRIPATRKFQSIICFCNPDGSEETTLIKTPGTYVSLYWYTDASVPTLFFSEFTRFNARLVSFMLQGNKKIVLDFNGTCVGISLSQDANKAVYCRSGEIWLYTYDSLTRKGKHVKLISNDGKNISPILLENGDVIFCSDASQLSAVKTPHIFLYHTATKSVKPLAKDGFCVGPAYCPRTQKLAYSKRINGTLQIFICDMKTGSHKQITSDAGDKLDCTWSPCGSYLAFCYQHNRTSRIALLHVGLNKRFYITSDKAYCANPAWSPTYTA